MDLVKETGNEPLIQLIDRVQGGWHANHNTIDHEFNADVMACLCQLTVTTELWQALDEVGLSQYKVGAVKLGLHKLKDFSSLPPDTMTMLKMKSAEDKIKLQRIKLRTKLTMGMWHAVMVM